MTHLFKTPTPLFKHTFFKKHIKTLFMGDITLTIYYRGILITVFNDGYCKAGDCLVLGFGKMMDEINKQYFFLENCMQFATERFLEIYLWGHGQE